VMSFLLLFVFVSHVLSVSIGNQLVRTYTKYIPLPITSSQAIQHGWIKSGTCVAGHGIPYNFQQPAPNKSTPLTIYYSPNGAVTGVSVEVYGSVEQNLLDKGYWVPTGTNQWRITVVFRDPRSVCGSVNGNDLGDRLVINPTGIARALPVTEKDASNQKWHKGSCFQGMGHHWFYDLATAPRLSWESSNLLPVVTMYDQGLINAIFFASSTVQQGLLDAHWWEPIPLPNVLMCKNTCDDDCTFSGTLAWSTFHIYFKNYTAVTCANDCQIGCCP